MRPERLELEGFTAFRQRSVVDFTDAELFALSGPTGAGKSSLIDAIIFVLYGNVPRLADRRRVGPVISQGKVEARIGLDFSVGAEQYRVVRVVRATAAGGATTKEARLEHRPPDAAAELLAGDADGVTTAIETLLGLTYEHFTTAVVLPQGDFARFLHHKPKDRQDLLKQLLDLGLYDRVQRRARTHAELAGQRAALAQSRLDELAGATEDAARELAARRRAVRGLLDACAAAMPELDALGRQLDAAAAAAKEQRAAATLLRRVAVPDGTDDLAGRHDTALAEVRRLEERAAPLDEDVAAREAALAQLPGEAASTAVIELHRDLDAQRRLVTKGEAAAASAKAANEAAAAAHADALRALGLADAARSDAESSQLAATLLGHLHDGDPCPVCGNDVDLARVPDATRRAADAVRAATAEHTAATEAERTAAGALRAAETDQIRIEAKLGEARQRLSELQQRAAGAVDAETAAAQLDAARQAADAVRTARTARAELGVALDAARTALRRIDEAQRQAWAAFDTARDRLGRLEPPAADRTDLRAAWVALAAWAGARELDVLRAAAAAEADRDALASEQEARTASLVQLATTVLPDAGRLGGPAAIRDRALATDGHLAAAAERLDADRERAAAVRAELARATEERQVAGELHKQLAANRFGAWILDEAVQQLVSGATGLLQRLSNGAYSLVLDGKDFAVIDHNNADAVRSARTLSGGETFLASLALALALAEQVVLLAGPTAAPLESLFLDEGFGTLDPDTLDTVASAIEELGSQGRMVGIVTHVRDLAERLPVRFEVRKGPEGAHVERVLA